jgi:tripartite-type tricarboxylate transporter receptor subunit TctC
MRSLLSLNRRGSASGAASRLLRALTAGAAMLLALNPATATAQAYPTGPVRIIVPFTAGGVADVITRGVATGLAATWGHPVVVENKAGASTIIGSAAVAKAAPDGHTMLMANDPSLSMNQYLYSKLPYDPVRDFTPVINVAGGASVLIASPRLKANNITELIALAKQRPGELTYGSFGPGSSTHLRMELFADGQGIRLNHIPYKGIADVMPAVMSGQIDMAFASVAPVLPLIRAGKVKALGYANPERSPVLPEVPTFVEQGVDFNARAWFGLAVPAGTPKPIVDKIARDVSAVISTREFDQKYLSGVGMYLLNQGPEAYAKFLEQDRRSWEQAAKRANVKLD